MESEAVQQAHAEMNLISDVVHKVSDLCGWRLEWIAKQTMSDGRDDVYGFVIGRSFATVTVEEARNADDALIHRLATEIMGYAPGSFQNLAWREFYLGEVAADLERQIERQMGWLTHYHVELAQVISDMAALPPEEAFA